jgi:TonB family protein
MTLIEERKPLFYSLALHLSILLVLVVKPYFSSGVKPFEKSIKVDIIAMPEKGQKIIPVTPKPKEPSKTKVKEKAKPKSQVKKEVKKKAVTSKKTAPKALESDAFKKLEAIKQKQKEQEALTALEQKKQEIKGNRVSRGTGLVGVEKLEYTNYKEIIHNAIKADWELPGWLLESELQAVVEIKIDHDGNLVYKNLVQSSGNKIYDEKVMEAINNAAPFDPPPDKFKGIVMYEGVVLTFP